LEKLLEIDFYFKAKNNFFSKIIFLKSKTNTSKIKKVKKSDFLV